MVVVADLVFLDILHFRMCCDI